MTSPIIPSSSAPMEPAGQNQTSSQRQRPGALTLICIFAFLLAVLAFLGSASSLVFGGPGAMQTFANLHAGGAAAAHIQQQMITDMMAALEPWQPWATTLAWINLAVGVLLTTGGLLAIKMRSPGDRLLLVAFGSALLADVMGTPLMVASQRAMNAAMESWIPLIINSTGDPNMPPGFEQTMQWMMRAGLLVSIVFGALLVLAKMGFCGYGIWYLRKPATRALFTTP